MPKKRTPEDVIALEGLTIVEGAQVWGVMPKSLEDTLNQQYIGAFTIDEQKRLHVNPVVARELNPAGAQPLKIPSANVGQRTLSNRQRAEGSGRIHWGLTKAELSRLAENDVRIQTTHRLKILGEG